MKKIFALTLALLMALTMLVGCGKGELVASLDPTEAPDTDPTAAPATDAPDITPGENTESGDLVSKYAIAQPAKAEYPVNPESARDENDNVDWSEYDALLKKWTKANMERREKAADAPDMNAFMTSLTHELMKEHKGKNLAFSPANIYIALAMLAETAEGNTRAEILEVLGSPDIETLRKQTAALLAAESWDDGVQKSALANSIWMNKNIIYNADTLNKIAEVYGASSFSGDMAQKEYSEALCAWLDENTGGLLKDAIEGTEFDPMTVLAIASTIYFKDSWEMEFNKENTYEDIFHADTGDITCDFMHKNLRTECFMGDNYVAMREPLNSDGAVYMLLPDEGVTVEEMLEGGALDAFGRPAAALSGEWKELDVKLSVPKLDISSKFDMKSVLWEMGMKDCFDWNSADFSPLTDLPNVYVDEVTHAARVKTDEEGIEAAAYTIIWMKAAGAFMEIEKIELNFDRPFAFVVTGVTGAPLFVGIVNTPND